MILFLVAQNTAVFRGSWHFWNTHAGTDYSPYLLLLLKFKFTGDPGEAAKFQVITLSKTLDSI